MYELTTMRHKKALAIVAGLVLFAFFVPVIYPACYPMICRNQGHACVGSCFPSIGSISYWLFGYGGAIMPNYHSQSLQPSVYRVVL